MTSKISDVPVNGTLQTEISTPSNPASGKQRVFVDSADHKLKRINSSGTVIVIEGAASGDVVGPGSSTDGHLAVFDGATGKLIKDGGAAGGAISQTATGGQITQIRTKLMMHFNGSNNSTVFTDEAGNVFSAISGAKLSTSQKNFGTASLALNGSSDYIVGNLQNTIGPLDFCLEFFLYPTAAQNSVLYDCRSGGGSANGFSLYLTSGQKLTLYTAGGDRIGGATNVSLNTWHHIALTREAGNIKAWLDGAQEGSTYSSTASFTDTGIYIGKAIDVGYYVAGYMDEMRLVVGSAIYTSAFTPPAAELPNPFKPIYCDPATGIIYNL